jgi:hypothetical protein
MGPESNHPLDHLESIFQNAMSNCMLYNFQNESQIINTFQPRPENAFLIGETVFSNSLKNKIISQKNFFFNLGFEINKLFPSVSIHQFFNFLMLIRKYTLFMFESDELRKLPLFSLPMMEYLEFSSSNPNVKMKPFLNFMHGNVI